MSENNMKDKVIHPQTVYYLLITFTAAVLAAGLLGIYNNTVRSSPIFMFILFLGIGIMLALGIIRGGVAGLLLVIVWIIVKQAIGVWSEGNLLFNLLEMAMVVLAFIISGIFRDRLKIALDGMAENQAMLELLDLEDKTIGLVKPSIGLIRLKEEEGRSLQLHRLFSLILMTVQPPAGTKWEPKENAAVMRACAANIKKATRNVGIPFLAAENKIAVILPETNKNAANKTVTSILMRLKKARFMSKDDKTRLIREFAQVRFGFATFPGKGKTRINMLEAADSSLQKNVQANHNHLIQDLPIEWATVGEGSASAPAATPEPAKRPRTRKSPDIAESTAGEK